jgi:hypothetical protein
MAPLPPPAPAASTVQPPAPEPEFGFFGPAPSASGSAAGLSPPFLVGAVFVIPSTNPPPRDPIGGDRFRLFESPTTCAEARGPNPPRHIETTAEAKAGSQSVFTQISFSNGVMSSYRGSITVVSVPKKPRAKGRIRLDHLPDGNIQGGELEATWCW